LAHKDAPLRVVLPGGLWVWSWVSGLGLVAGPIDFSTPGLKVVLPLW
jgi:hypothetical protein